VIHTLLPAASVQLWKLLGGMLLGLGVGTLGYALAQWRRGRELPLAYAATVLPAFLLYLYLYGIYADELVPSAVPRWMGGDDVLLYGFTFLMPTLAHALFLLVVQLTPQVERAPLWSNFGLALGLPILWYLLCQLILPLFNGWSSQFGNHVVVVLTVVGTLLALFFLLRGVYVLGWQKNSRWSVPALVWKVPITLLLPVLGLLVNGGRLWHELGSSIGIFGDFSTFWFYALAVLNGVLLCLPNPTQLWLRLLLFVGRSIMLAYTGYFFLVFLPFLPLSLLAVVAVGVGFLMLTPLVLSVVHVRELALDYQYLCGFFSAGLLQAALLLGVAVLPLSITATYLHDRAVLHRALAYVYTPTYGTNESVGAESLRNTLAVVQQHKDRNGSLVGSHLPYLSTYFNWLVLDNLTLSDEKIRTMQQIFMGTQDVVLAARRQRETLPAAEVIPPRLSRLHATSQFDSLQQTWVSLVDLEIRNTTQTDNLEYATTITLPVGCWVDDYYLYINGRKEPGILAEKRAATWVFNQIRNENRDPGLLSYESGNRVALRVFPLAAGETRRTGVRVLHRDATELVIDGAHIALGTPAAVPAKQAPAPASVGRGVAYVSATEKKRLPLVQRRPYYHFLLDVSTGKAPQAARYAHRVEELMRQNPSAGPARFSLVNAYVMPVPATIWPHALTTTTYAGGYFLDRALREVLVEAYQHPQGSYPVLVAVTDSLEHAVLPGNLADFDLTCPESDVFYQLHPGTGELTAHSLHTRPMAALPSVDSLEPQPVRVWPNAQRPVAYLPNDDQPSLVLLDSELPAVSAAPHTWQAGLQLQGQWLSSVLYPAAADSSRLALIQGSFRTGILTPLTAFLSLENEAQKAALRRKQQQTLAAHAALDTQEVQRMSEPGWVACALLLGALLVARWWQARRAVAIAGPTATA